MSRKSIFLALSVLVLLSLVLSACNPQTVEVVKTVVVTQEVQVGGETQIQEVVVTATPEPVVEEPRTLVICQGQEPETLYANGNNMLAMSHILEAIYDGPVDANSFAYQAVIFQKLASLADGDATLTAVDVAEGDSVVGDDAEVHTLTATHDETVGSGATVTGEDGSSVVLHLAGDPIVDADGNPVLDESGNPTTYETAARFRPAGCTEAACAVEYTGGDVDVTVEGTKVRPAGCAASDCAITFTGGALQMDQMSVTTMLLPGLTWSDGTPLTSADQIYGFNLAADPDTPLSKYLPDRTASYEAPDDVTTVWTGLPGYKDATYYLNAWTPRPQHVWGQYTAADLLTAVDANSLYVGWGAYIIDEWVRGDHISLHRNPNYFRASEGLPKFENVVFRFVGENSNANIAAVLSGECDIADQTSGLDNQSELLLELQAAGQINPTFVTGTVWEHADFNVAPIDSILNQGSFAGWDQDGDGQGPFGDVRLRRAVAMCMDRQAVVDTILFGQSVVLDTYLPPVHPLFNAEATHWPFDVAAATALLDEIGWLDADGDPATPRVATGVTGVPDGTLLQFNYNSTGSTLRQQVTQVLGESMLQCGIQADLGYYPASEWFADGPDGYLMGRRYDLGEFAWLTGVEPACDLYRSDQIMAPENGWSGQNQTGWANADYDAACFKALQSLPGQDSYTEGHLEAQRIFSEELPVVPLFLRLKLAATRPDMCNFIMDPTANSEMWNIEAFDYGASCNQ